VRRGVEQRVGQTADGGGAAPHNAGDAAVGGTRGGDRPFAARERAAAHGARYSKKVDCDLCWNSEMRFRETGRCIGDLAAGLALTIR
jgi:hypothetical protein